MEQLNPYRNRSAVTEPDEFIGRMGELTDLYQRILQGMSVSLVGERRVGKSSLLNALTFKRLEYGVPEHLRFVLLDMQSMDGCDEHTLLVRLLDLIEDETDVRCGDGARQDIDEVLATRRKLPSLNLPAHRLKAAA